MFIDATANTYKLGTYAGYGLSLTATTGYVGSSTLNYRYTATTASIGTTSLLLNIDNTAGSIALGALTRGISMQVVGGSPTYYFGNLIGQIGVFLGQTTGYLGNPTFGYNYTATTMIAGNSSINLTLNDTTNIANLGTTSTGLEVAATTGNIKTKVAGLTTGVFLDVVSGEFTFGTDMETPANASYFGARGTGGATPSIVMTQDFIDLPVGPVPAEYVRVTIPGLGDRFIQLYQ